MSARSRFIPVACLLALCAFGAAADVPPAPLVKPVVPAASAVRLRVPVIEGARVPAQLKAMIPKPQGKKGETIDVKVLIDTLPSRSLVGLNTWKNWGFEVPANRIGVIPELIIPAAQLAPANPKGRDVEFRATNVKVNIVEPPAGQDAVFGKCDVWLSLRDLSGGAGKGGCASRGLYFGDKFIELTALAATVKTLNAGVATLPDAQATAGDLVPVVGTMNATGMVVFSFASINGVAQYMTSTGKMEPVNAGVSSVTNYPVPGILMTLNTARGCGVELDKQPGEGETVTGKVKEFRLALLTGAGFKSQKDLVLKDVTVNVNDDKSRAAVWLGARFVEEYFTDAVYGCGTDGVWHLHGRVKAELLQDIKTRTPPKKQ